MRPASTPLLFLLCASGAGAASAEQQSPAPAAAAQQPATPSEAKPAPVVSVQPAAEPGEPTRAPPAFEQAVAEPTEGRSGGPARPRASLLVQDEVAIADTPPAPAGDEKLAIGESIRRQSADVEECYSKSLQRNPLLMGKLIAQFDIGPRGKVIGATAEGIPDRELLVCVAQVVRKWDFPRPASGGKLRVRYPWRLEPRASALPASAPLGSAK